MSFDRDALATRPPALVRKHTHGVTTLFEGSHKDFLRSIGEHEAAEKVEAKEIVDGAARTVVGESNQRIRTRMDGKKYDALADEPGNQQPGFDVDSTAEEIPSDGKELDQTTHPLERKFSDKSKKPLDFLDFTNIGTDDEDA